MDFLLGMARRLRQTAGAGAPTEINVKQKKTKSVSNGSLTQTITFDGDVVAGNFLLVAGSLRRYNDTSSNFVTNITSNQGEGIKVKQSNDSFFNNQANTFVAYAHNAVGGATTFTLTLESFSGAQNPNVELAAMEIELVEDVESLLTVTADGTDVLEVGPSPTLSSADNLLILLSGGELGDPQSFATANSPALTEVTRAAYGTTTSPGVNVGYRTLAATTAVTEHQYLDQNATANLAYLTMLILKQGTPKYKSVPLVAGAETGGTTPVIIPCALADIHSISFQANDNRDYPDNTYAYELTAAQIASGGGEWTRTVISGWTMLDANHDVKASYRVFVSLISDGTNTVVCVNTGNYTANIYGEILCAVVQYENEQSVTLGIDYQSSASVDTKSTGSIGGVVQADILGGMCMVEDPRGGWDRNWAAHWDTLTENEGGWTHSTDTGWDVMTDNFAAGGWDIDLYVRTKDNAGDMDWEMSGEHYGGTDAGYTATANLCWVYSL